MRLALVLVLALAGCRHKETETGDTGTIGTFDTAPVDLDGDGFTADEDCDDGNSAVYPGNTETPYNGMDDDCDETTPDDDLDGDGVGVADDCDDEDDEVAPGLVETCDGKDNDCSGEADDAVGDLFYADLDEDGYGDANTVVQTCEGATGYVADNTDCDDENEEVNPAATETCNEIDDDCDLLIDDDDPDVADPTTWYRDGDGDGWGDDATFITACEVPSEYGSEAGDCNDGDATVNPDATEICNGFDDDCDGAIDADDDSVEGLITTWLDADGDGHGSAAWSVESCDVQSGFSETSDDCDDSEPLTYPGAKEICDGEDNDCDGDTDDDDPDLDTTTADTWYKDGDGDGFGNADSATVACTQPSGTVENTDDCDDTDASVSPLGTEVCNDTDDDCNGSIDDSAADASTWYDDKDEDGYGDASATTDACDAPSGTVSNSNDCDDSTADVNPGAAEVCNGVDDDCDGDVDPDSSTDAATWYDDDDGDGYGDATSGSSACEQPKGTVADSSDCDDGEASTNPAATEVCDGVDNNCDGDTDESGASGESTWYTDKDGDGEGNPDSSVDACNTPTGMVSNSDDCDDTDAAVNTHATEICDGVDNDCDGTTDIGTLDGKSWYADSDEDGFGDPDDTTTVCDQPTGYVSTGDDCDDGDADIHPDAEEICDGVDNDCDGDADSDATDMTTWYLDADGDGAAGETFTTTACDQPSGYLASATDCNDADASALPGATEICDEVDNDCDESVDESVESTWYLDYDGDGWGADSTATDACDAPSSYYVDVGGDCDDTDTGYSPDATPACDGEDHDCDGVVDNDADLDGYADAACGGDDCDDSDATIMPEIGSGCAIGTTCLDILDDGRSIGDGEYTIDPDGYGTGVDPFDATCDMTTDGGGWTAIEYASDLAYQQHFTDGDYYRYLPEDFEFVLTDSAIQAIQDLSSEGFQVYEGRCEHVIHYYYNDGGNYDYAFGFMFFDGTETPYASESYSPHDIAVTFDGCAGNGGEGGDLSQATVFEINSPLVPLRNIQCSDCGDAFPEELGANLTDWPAWLR